MLEIPYGLHGEAIFKTINRVECPYLNIEKKEDQYFLKAFVVLVPFEERPYYVNFATTDNEMNETYFDQILATLEFKEGPVLGRVMGVHNDQKCCDCRCSLF